MNAKERKRIAAEQEQEQLDASQRQEAFRAGLRDNGLVRYNHLRGYSPMPLGPLFGFPRNEDLDIASRVVGNVSDLWPHVFRQLQKSDEDLALEVYGLDPKFNGEVTPREHIGLLLEGMGKGARQRGDQETQELIGAFNYFVEMDPTDREDASVHVDEINDLLDIDTSNPSLKIIAYVDHS